MGPQCTQLVPQQVPFNCQRVAALPIAGPPDVPISAGKTKHIVAYSALFGTALTCGVMQLLDTRYYLIVAAGSLCTFAFYGLGLAVVQGLPITPKAKLTSISR